MDGKDFFENNELEKMRLQRAMLSLVDFQQSCRMWQLFQSKKARTFAQASCLYVIQKRELTILNMSKKVFLDKNQMKKLKKQYFLPFS